MGLPVLGTNVAVEHQFLGVVDQQPGIAVNDALGLAGGTTGIENARQIRATATGVGHRLRAFHQRPEILGTGRAFFLAHVDNGLQGP